jgi:lipopolysaccharide/colanic/teichoic acid biosynthesis glycosyltransferase
MKTAEAGRLIGERAVATILLILATPLLVVIAVATVIESGWPFLFLQTRVGRGGRAFRLVKIRSMRQSTKGQSITASGDPRVTRVGKIVRKFKLDELPQLWNVLRGEMSLVGPRPEIPEFVDLDLPIWKSVLEVRPGITDPVSIAYRDEEKLLAAAEDPIRYYRETVLPDKLRRNLAYLRKRSLWSDLRVLAETVRCAALPTARGTKV